MRVLILLLFICFISCVRKKEQVDFYHISAFPLKGLSPDAFYVINYLDSPMYKIKWGNKNIDTLTTDTTYSVLGSGAAGYMTSNKEAIFLEQECGTDCNYVIVLPFNKDVKPKVFYECIAIDTSNNLIAYITENDSSFFAIENFLTNKVIKIREHNICQSVTKLRCIDSCYFDNTFFYLKSFGHNYRGVNEPDWIIKRYSTKEVAK